MSKNKITYKCNSCEYQAAKWLGCCPRCQEWDSFEEQNIQAQAAKHFKASSLKTLNTVSSRPIKRLQSGIKEWDRVTGGGIVPGSFTVITGDPGIGKSTLLLQISHNLAQSHSVIYFSTEESLEQVKLRAERLSCIDQKLLFADQANLENIIATSEQTKPDIVIIDSIQNCYTQESLSIPGTVGQLKEAAFKLMRLAKEHIIAVIVTGHITKEGIIAGPKTLEHMVDTVLYLQGEDRWQTRILRSVKNRFGTVHELGFFQMAEQGLQEVPNINQHLLSELSSSPGSILISYIEGSRPLLIELQSLAVASKYGMPQRVISGIEHNEVILIAAILEKYLHIKLSTQDIFFKISGSFKIKKGTGADLGIALALLSSYFQKPLPEKSLALGEISLTGQVKPVNNINLHISEAEKFGIKNLLLAKNQQVNSSCTIIKFYNVYDLLKVFED